MTDAERDARYDVPVWNQDVKLYEDYEVGEVDRSIRRTISEGEMMVFSSLLVDLHPYVADDIFAREQGMFGRRIVPGALVFSYGMGLMAHNNVNTFSYGYDRLRFIKPVFVGDTIYTMRTLLKKAPKYDEMGLFTVSYEVFRADDEQIVLYCEHLQTVRYRDPEAAKASE
ncbi:MaoC family dehydratase [soil metagenome]